MTQCLTDPSKFFVSCGVGYEIIETPDRNHEEYMNL